MRPVSDRRHDTFDNAAKSACREGNLRALQETAYRLWEDGDRRRLRCDWCELMGETGTLTLDMLEEQQVLRPGGFVGVDLDAGRIGRWRAERPDLKWVAGNLYEVLEEDALAEVGVLNLDEYGEVSGGATADLRLVRGLVQRGLRRFGEFALFWNKDLDSVVRRGKRRGASLRRHAEFVCEALDGLLPRRTLTPEMLLPAGAEQQVEAGGVGTVGAFEIYRGSRRGHRMANLRLILF